MSKMEYFYDENGAILNGQTLSNTNSNSKLIAANSLFKVLLDKSFNFSVIPNLISKKSPLTHLSCSPKTNHIFLAYETDGKTRLKEINLQTKATINEFSFEGGLRYLMPRLGQVLVSHDPDDTTLVQYDYQNEKIVYNYNEVYPKIWANQFAEDLNWLVVSDTHRHIGLWELSPAKKRLEFKVSSVAEIVGLINDRAIYGYGRNGVFWVYDLQEKQFIFETSIDVVEEVVYSVTFDCLFLKALDQLICYDANKNEIRWTKKIAQSEYFSIHLLQNHLVINESSIFYDGILYFVDVETGTILQQLQNQPKSIYTLALSSKGYLYTAGFGEAIYIRSLPEGNILGILEGHIHKIKELIIDPNEKFIVSADRLGRVICWHMKEEI